MLKKLLNYSILVYVFLLPWQARFLFAEYSLETPYYGGLSLYLTDGLFFLVLLLWFFWLITERSKILPAIKNLSPKIKLVSALSLVFLLYALVSVIWFPFDSTAFEGGWKPYEAIAFFKWLRLLQAFTFGLILATSSLKIRSIFVALLASGLWQSFWGIQQFFLQEISANTFLGVAAQTPADLGVSVVEYADQRWLRAYGGFPHPNILGAFLSLCSLLACAWMFSVYKQIGSLKDRWQTVTVKEIQPIRIQVIVSLMTFCFVLIGLLFTFSRTAWLGFASGWVILFFALIYLAKTKYDKKLMIFSGMKQVVAGALIFSALTFLVGPLWSERANDTSRLGQKSSVERTELIDQAQDIIDQAPVQGSGIGSYVVKVRELAPNEDVFIYQPVHNLWLLLWAELGIVGLLPFLGLLLFLLFTLQTISKKKIDSLNELTVLCLLISMGVMVYFEHFWWTLVFGNLLLSISLGLFLKAQLFNKN